MKKFITIAAFAAVLPFSGAVLAQDVPGWPATGACSKGDDACPAFESEYKGQVTGIWNTLPPDVRSACVSETESVEKSYRLLYDCLANKMQERMKKQQQHS